MELAGLTQKEVDAKVREAKAASIDTGDGVLFVFRGTCAGSRRGKPGPLISPWFLTRHPALMIVTHSMLSLSSVSTTVTRPIIVETAPVGV